MNALPAHRRDPDHTRQVLLDAAFQEIYRNGFQAASLEQILKDTEVTKGALYHHFKSKRELGYAVIEEVIRPMLLADWLAALTETDDPLASLRRIIGQLMDDERAQMACTQGCPLNNLAQEMSPLDEGFRQRIHSLFETWRRSIAQALRQGQAHGTVRDDVDPDAMATFVLAAFEGTIGIMKNSQDIKILEESMKGLDRFLSTLEPDPTASDV